MTVGPSTVSSHCSPDPIYRVGGGEHVGHESMRRFLGGVGFKDGQPHWTDDDQLMVMPRSLPSAPGCPSPRLPTRPGTAGQRHGGPEA